MLIDEKRLALKPTLADGLLIVSCALIGIFVFLILLFGRSEGERIIISCGGEVLGEYSLSQDGEYSFLDGAVVVTVSGGEAFVSHADCPDKSCILMGKISKGGESIICLPNRISITVEGRGEVDIPLS